MICKNVASFINVFFLPYGSIIYTMEYYRVLLWGKCLFLLTLSVVTPLRPRPLNLYALSIIRQPIILKICIVAENAIEEKVHEIKKSIRRSSMFLFQIHTEASRQ